MERKNVVIGYLGTQLDAAAGAGRWNKWRPSVSMAQQPDLPVHRIELFYGETHLPLAERIAADIVSVSPDTEVRLTLMPLQDPWDFGEVYASLYDWARHYPFDTRNERYHIHITTGTHVAQICLFLMVETRFIPGILLQTSPPRRQRAGNLGSYSLIDLDLSRYDILAQRFAQARSEAQAFLKSGIVTRNARFNALIEEIERVAVRSRAPILVSGPTGAGKSHLARRMYELKKARHQVQGPFVEVNCATLRGDGAASTLFGHRRGAFTGAASERAGLLRSAHLGVLFLDEIGELGLDEQAMLLKAIEEKRFYPLGSDQEVESDFQLIAGTHRDLRDDVRDGRFREDLFARINLWSYTLPGLSERPEDIEPNIDYLLRCAAAEDGQQLVRFHADAKRRYLEFAQSPQALWRGNFRDLAASITRLVTLADNGRISNALVEAEIERLRWLWHERLPQATQADSATPALHALLTPERLAEIDLFEQLQLQAVLQACQSCNSLAEAGRMLFNHSRTLRSAINDSDRLRKYLARYGLRWADLAHSTTNPQNINQKENN